MEVTEVREKFQKLHDDVTALVDKFMEETGIEIYDVKSNVPHYSKGNLNTAGFIFLAKL